MRQTLLIYAPTSIGMEADDEGGKRKRVRRIRKQEGGKHTTLQLRVKKGRKKLSILFLEPSSSLPPHRSIGHP